jgi:hypothetical protein
MPHPIPVNVRVKKRDGELTGPLSQQRTESFLGNLIDKNRLANLKQALNDVFGGKGKATGPYRQDDQAVLHASSGNGEKSVTVFYYISGQEAIVFAMGEHTGSNTYKVTDFGQPTGDFVEGANIKL